MTPRARKLALVLVIAVAIVLALVASFLMSNVRKCTEQDSIKIGDRILMAGCE